MLFFGVFEDKKKIFWDFLRFSEIFWPLVTTKTLNWPNGRLPNSLKICCFMSWDSLYPGNFALRVWKKRGKYSQVLAWVDGTTFLNDLIKWVENFWASFQWTKNVHKWSKRFQTASPKCQKMPDHWRRRKWVFSYFDIR